MAELVAVKIDDQTTVLFESSEKSTDGFEVEGAQDLVLTKLDEIAQATNPAALGRAESAGWSSRK